MLSAQDDTASEVDATNTLYRHGSYPTTPAAASERRCMLEKSISENLSLGRYFVVAAALRCIEEEKLYPPEKNIYAYGKNLFGFSRRSTNTYLCSSYVYESITEDKTLPIPGNISHVRSLHKHSPEARRYIWKLLCKSGLSFTEENVVAMTIKYETGVAFSDLSNELYTPRNIIAAAKTIIGSSTFSLDPASCVFANTLHTPNIADTIFTEHNDGMRQQWHGHVWLSPPFGVDDAGLVQQSLWFEAAESKYKSGEILSCHLLLRVGLSSEIFSRVLKYPHCFFHDRLVFLTPTGREKLLRDSYMLVYMGKKIREFCTKFTEFGSVPGYNSWSFSDIDKSIPTEPALTVAPSVSNEEVSSQKGSCVPSMQNQTTLSLSSDTSDSPKISKSKKRRVSNKGPKIVIQTTLSDKLEPGGHALANPTTKSTTSSSESVSLPSTAPALSPMLTPTLTHPIISNICDPSHIQSHGSSPSNSSQLSANYQPQFLQLMNQPLQNVGIGHQTTPLMQLSVQSMVMHESQLAFQTMHSQFPQAHSLHASSSASSTSSLTASPHFQHQFPQTHSLRASSSAPSTSSLTASPHFQQHMQLNASPQTVHQQNYFGSHCDTQYMMHDHVTQQQQQPFLLMQQSQGRNQL